MKKAFVYILTNNHKNVLYVGSTNDLKQRIDFHKRGLIKGFTKKYNVKNLVYFLECKDMDEARSKETALKKTNRTRKLNLINKLNAEWKDLYQDI